jgi:hypothetical protein
MRTLYSLGILTLGLAVASSGGCGGDSDENFAGAGGAAAGTSGSGGSSGSGASSGSGGSSAAGGSSGTGGTGGSGGSAGDSGDCAPPGDPARAALCLTLELEPIQFESDLRLDGRGVLIVQLYDTPAPDNPDGGPDTTPVSEQIYPPQPDAGMPAETMITEVPPLRFVNVPTTVYVRAIFVDNFETFILNRTTWGTWLGGYNFFAGLVENIPIQPVQIPAGTGRALRLPMVALRRLRTTVTLASGVTPLDDGEGPASVLAVRSATPRENEPIYGVGSTPCVRVASGSTPTLEAILVGSGTFYLAAGVDDYALGGNLPRGGLVSLDVNGSMFSLPAASRVDVAQNAYTVNHTVPLNFLVPLGDAGTPPSFSCTTADAGTSG